MDSETKVKGYVENGEGECILHDFVNAHRLILIIVTIFQNNEQLSTWQIAVTHK